MHSWLQVWVKGGHAEHVAAATGSPQKADPLDGGRRFRVGPIPARRAAKKQVGRI
jgi:hypothetical protein